MVSKKKTFQCGHVGFGKYCHLCRQLESGELIEVSKGMYKPNPAHMSESKRTKERLAVYAKYKEEY